MTNRSADGASRATRENSGPRITGVDEDVNVNSGFNEEIIHEDDHSSSTSIIDSEMDSIEASTLHGSSNYLVSPNWLHGKDLGKGEVEYLKSDEEIFWKQFISTYLDPIDKDEKREVMPGILKLQKH